MEIEVCAPELPEELEKKATLLFWHKEEKDAVEEGEDLVEIETTKCVFMIPSPAKGTLIKILVKAGESIKSEQKLGIIKSD